MEKDVRNYVKTRQRYVLSKTPEHTARAPPESIKTTAPLELVCIDFWSAEDNRNNSLNFLVINDYFTKLAPKKLWYNFFCVHSDQGAKFQSELIAELLELASVEKC